MSSIPKDDTTTYSKRLGSLANPQTPPVQQTGENDNNRGIIRPSGKCYTISPENSAIGLGFHFNGEVDDCLYMLRRRFRFVKGTMILKFTDETLFIEGRNLGKLFMEIRRHKVDGVFVADYPEREDDTEPYIDSIILKPTSEVNIDDDPPTKPER